MARAIADVERRTVQQLAQADLARSGLVKHARRLGMQALSAQEVRAKGARFHEAGALLIPYWDLNGKPTKFFRIRYLEKLPGVAGAAKNAQRYDQLPILQEAYYPPLLKKSWKEIADDPETSVCITEGEKKAACACVHKIPMMALGGVYSFMSGKRAIDLLPSMKEFVWKERQVYIVYDNDLMNNPDVLRAQYVLSQRLLGEGAKIRYISIPHGPHKGVDDFLLAKGTRAFADLIENALPQLEGEALWKLNSEVVYVKEIDAVVERDTHRVMDTDKFMRHIYANRHYMAQVEKGSGKAKHIALEKQPLARRWVEWEQRAELQRLTYEPGAERILDGAWNMWNGFGTTPKKGPVGQWSWMLDFLFEKDDRAKKYFEQWCAYPVKHPGAKMFTACLLWSRVKRLGKSSVGLALSKIYGENAYTIGTRQLKSQFNKWACNRQLVIGEEITAGKDHLDADYMKYLITSPTFPIRAMYRDEYEIPNHSNFIFFSNWADALFLEDGDKRYFVHGIRQQKQAPPEKYQWFHKWLREDGASHLMHHFQCDVSFRGFDPFGPAPESASKWEMIQVGKNNVALWVQRLTEDPVSALRSLGEKMSEGCDLFSSEQLYRAFDPSSRGPGEARSGGAASLGKHLHGAGFRLVNQSIPVATTSGIHRLYAVRNPVRWEQASRKELREHYDSFFSPQTAGGVK